MGFLKTLGKGLGEFLFITCLSTTILALVMAELTEYSNLKPIAVGLLTQQLTKQIDATKLPIFYAQIVNQCSGKEIIEMPMGEEENVTLKCSDVAASKQEGFISLIATNVFEKIYYKKYDCEFLQCYQQAGNQEKIMLFASSTANQFLNKVLIYLWIGTAVSAIVLIASCKDWEIPKNFGKGLIVIGVPYLFINFLKEKISLPAEASIAQPIIDQIFNSMSSNLLIILIVGVVLTIIGYVGNYLSKKSEKKK